MSEPELNLDLFRRLPKAELHCHLDGSLRLQTILDLASQYKVSLPTRDPDALLGYLTVGEKVGSLENYLSRFVIPLQVLQWPEALSRAARELAEDAWEDGVRYIEIRYSPALHTKEDMTEADTVEAVKAGLEEAEDDLGIGTGIIITGIRSISPEVSLRLADLAENVPHTLYFRSVRGCWPSIWPVRRKTSPPNTTPKLSV